MKILVQRIYDKPIETRGYRVLVDRVWPRGVSKADARLDEWVGHLAPSTALRKWFNHDPSRWNKFRIKYRQELMSRREELKRLQMIARKKPLVLLYGARDKKHNQAVYLREVLENMH